MLKLGAICYKHVIIILYIIIIIPLNQMTHIGSENQLGESRKVYYIPAAEQV